MKVIKRVVLFLLNKAYYLFPKTVVKIMYRIKTGKRLNLENPKSYNEKIQWIKLYDRNPLMPICSDKYLVRSYVESKGLKNILNEIYWEGTNSSNIPIDLLPNQFVMKVTHGSGMNLICVNKLDFDFVRAKKTLDRWLKTKYMPAYGEWFYLINQPRIVIEKYLVDSTIGKLYDYKFFCFNGQPKLIYIDTWANNHHSINTYDIEFNFLESVSMGYPNDLSSIDDKPKQLDQLIEYSKVLSEGFLHARVDFYVVDEKIYFGEITFTKGSGYSNIEPEEFNMTMGEWIDLKRIKSGIEVKNEKGNY